MATTASMLAIATVCEALSMSSAPGSSEVPDDMLVPHARHPDETEKVCTDHEHAEAAF